MYTIFTMLLIGLIAAGVMTLFLAVINHFLLPDASVLPIIGSVIAREEANAQRAGLALQIILCVSFAFLYLWLAYALGFATSRELILFGAITGLAEGVVVGGLLAVVAEHHLLKQFHKDGFRFYAAYAFAHVIYGVSVGVATAVLRPNLNVFSDAFAASILGCIRCMSAFVAVS